MYKLLFEKYIDFSSPKHKHIARKLKGVDDFDKALKIVLESMVLTDSLIDKLKLDSTNFSEEDGEEIAKSKEEDENKLLAAEELAEKVKAENKKSGQIGKRQGGEVLLDE